MRNLIDQDGSLNAPFEDLQNAIEKVMELCAGFKKCEASILLFKGSHYLKKAPYEYLKPAKISRDQQNI